MNENKTALGHEKLADAINIWNHSAVTLLDIRHRLISRDEPLVAYRLPSSAFFYMRGEKAEVHLNSTSYNMERFGLFHSYKGSELNITPQCKWLEYYMVLYKAGETPFHKSELRKLLAQTNPFRQQYGFLPSDPLFFAEQLRRMYEKWKGPTPLNLFYGKTAFYQLVYEVYEELEQNNIQVLEPDIVAVARRYLERHYKENIAIQELCDSLGISHSHFHRRFKQQIGSSPQEYLIKTRLFAAKELLKQDDLSIREAASHCGFPDEINFYRQFVKHIGVAPSVYKQNLQRDMSDDAMENRLPFSYNWESQVRFGELEGKGATFMLKQMRSKAVVAAALSLMLLLSACGTEAVGNSKDSASITEVSSQVTTTEEATPMEEGTRIVSTAMGDVEVPVNPQRIAFFGMVGDMVAIGTMPICGNMGIQLFDGLLTKDTYTHAQIDDYEDILSSSPDLIFVSYQPKEGVYEKLSAIAPTVIIERLSMTMPDRIAFIGDIIGQEESAAQAVTKFDDLAADCLSKLEGAGITGKTMTVLEGEYLMGEKFGRGANLVYNYLGFTAPDKLQQAFDKGDLYLEVSMEVMPEYCGDYIIRSVWDGAEDWSENAIWNSIPAVANGHIVDINFDEYAFEDLYTSAKLMELITDSIVAIQGT